MAFEIFGVKHDLVWDRQFVPTVYLGPACESL